MVDKKKSGAASGKKSTEISQKAKSKPAAKKPTGRLENVAKALRDMPQKASHLGAKNQPDVNDDLGGAGPLYYVGIGASAGGLEALRPFVANLPNHASMTYIVAQHMSPDHRSLMVELLTRETKLNVQEAKNKQIPRPDNIYIVPPNSDVTVVNGKLLISTPTNTIGPKPSVDRFFVSLADDKEDRAIGIILSGTGSDGARGIKAIKAAGGITIAQEPRTAKYDSMPNAAIRSGGADVVLPPHDIANQLLAIVRRPRTPITDSIDDPSSTTIRSIIRQIAVHSGMDFANYKDATISRQILRRMAALQVPNLEAYGEHIKQNRGELNELASNFLICVTSFFRDPESYEAMRRTLREMLKTKKPGDSIRIWIPGCATGEEVYSTAIMLDQELGDHRDEYRIQLFATDINNDAISAARAGIYPESALSSLNGALITRYFAMQDGMYRIDQKLRDMTLFARQDLVQDPPFVRLDMVSCRNLLIYFKQDLQEKVLKVFHYSLNNNGILFLGKSESVGKLNELFIERDRKNKIYAKRNSKTALVGGFMGLRISGAGITRDLETKKPEPTSSSVLGHERLFELYAPASLLMTSNGDILEILGDCSNFLSIKKGKADFNAFSLIKQPFRAELRAFAHRVSRTKESATSGPIAPSEVKNSEQFRMAVHYVGPSGTDDPDLLLVCFEPTADRRVPHAAGRDADGASAELVSDLERELVLNRENLQTVIEELETANEELQSLNEEAQAANEELQASNEELETANEELQASNEELITVNDELGTRTHQLSETSTDLLNVVESLQNAVVVVDRSLNITRYNQMALDFFTILGESQSNLASVAFRFPQVGLLERVSQVLKNKELREVEFRGADGHFFLTRITPYLDSNRKGITGAVLTIANITARKQHELALNKFKAIVDSTADAVISESLTGNIESWNPGAERIFGYKAQEVLGKPIKILDPAERATEDDDILRYIVHGERVEHFETIRRCKDGRLINVSVTSSPVRDADHTIVGASKIVRDITDQKRAEAELRRSEESYRRQFTDNKAVMLLSDPETYRIVDANDAALTFYGYSREQMQSMSITDINPSSAPEIKEIIQSLLSNKGGRFETVHRRADGSTRHVDIFSSVIHLSGRTISHGIVHDITERKRVEEALVVAKDAAEQASRAKSDFLSSMSHELRTPLNAVLGFAQLLEISQNPPLSDKQKEQVGYILTSGRHLLALIDQILDLARIEAGKMAIAAEPIDLKSLIGECLTFVHNQAGERGVTLVPPDSAPSHVLVRGDHLRLKQILLNLLTNAIKYNRTDGKVVIALTSDERDSWRISVEDTGIGISRELQDHLFEPFNRLGAETSQVGGFGMGLAISKNLIEAMGGAIGFSSTPGQGSIFWIDLPRIADKADAGETKDAPQRIVVKRRGKHRPKLLYVEDSPLNASLVRSIITDMLNVDVEIATTAEIGLKIAMHETPTAILLDINLPGMSGLEAARHLQTDPRTQGIPLIAISADASPKTREDALGAGFLQYLSKPIDLKQLLETVSTILEKTSA